MSKAGKFVKKHPWEAAGLAAAAATGGAGLAGMGPLAGLLGGGGASVAGGAAAAELASPLASGGGLLAGSGSETMANAMLKGKVAGGLKTLARAQGMGLFGSGPQPGMAPTSMPQGMAPTNVSTMPTQALDPKDPQYLLKLMMMQQQGGHA